jgi:hypothetical protein
MTLGLGCPLGVTEEQNQEKKVKEKNHQTGNY